MTRGGTFAMALFPAGGVLRSGLQPSELNEAWVPGSVPGHCPGVGRAHLAQAGLPAAHLDTQASSKPSRCPCFYSRSASPQPGTPAKAKASLETLTRRGRGEAGSSVCRLGFCWEGHTSTSYKQDRPVATQERALPCPASFPRYPG